MGCIVYVHCRENGMYKINTSLAMMGECIILNCVVLSVFVVLSCVVLNCVLLCELFEC